MRSPRCPVEKGDIFYHRNRGTDTGACLPDRIRVEEVTEKDGMFYIRGKYLYHAVGPVFERTFSDIIFRDPDWVIEKKGA